MKEALKLALEALKKGDYALVNAICEELKQAQPEHDCTRSHPHEDMGKECELRTEIARLTNQQAHRSQAQLQLKMTALERAWFLGYENDIESAMHNLREEIIKEALAQQSNEQVEPVAFGSVTVRRLSQRLKNHYDQYQFYPLGESPYLDNVDECYTVYTHPPVPTAQPKEPEQEPVSDRENKIIRFALHQFMSNAYAHLNAAAQDKDHKRYPSDAIEEFSKDAKDAQSLLERLQFTATPQRKPLTDEQIYRMWTDEGLANSYDIYSLKEHVLRAARAIEAAHGIKGDA